VPEFRYRRDCAEKNDLVFDIINYFILLNFTVRKFCVENVEKVSTK